MWNFSFRTACTSTMHAAKWARKLTRSTIFFALAYTAAVLLRHAPLLPSCAPGASTTRTASSCICCGCSRNIIIANCQASSKPESQWRAVSSYSASNDVYHTYSTSTSSAAHPWLIARIHPPSALRRAFFVVLWILLLFVSRFLAAEIQVSRWPSLARSTF